MWFVRLTAPLNGFQFAVIVANFVVQMTNEKSGGKGRVVIGYCRDGKGSWKMALDVDNND
ncbi:hypothetical protein [Neptunomonas japonica]|uniref:hypothetical protein n=1 Tax=Neptunomonas japonica TaxID=417574 RepID=UPI0003F726A0|nr:hypothetical protein [Neptunomonas japonica]